jgi:HlyD family secretion protein
MFRRYVLPLLAAGLLVFAVMHALSIQRPTPKTPPPVSPPTSPFGDTVAGAGMVEPSTEASGTGNIAVGSQLAGAVEKIHVHIGQRVKAGDVLFELDKRQTEAELKIREANVVVAEAQLEVAKASLAQMKDRFERAKTLLDTPGAIAKQDYVTAEENQLTAAAQVALARGNVEQAKAQVDQTKTILALLDVCAPVDGTILQINTREGEYVSTFAGQSLIVMGNLNPLHVRVSIDEEDLPRLKLDAPARAKIRGDATQEEVPLTFVRLEPYIVPKTSLTGTNTERVDTRVVQVIYALDPNNPLVKEKKILVGQLVDVFIDTGPSSTLEAKKNDASEVEINKTRSAASPAKAKSGG